MEILHQLIKEELDNEQEKMFCASSLHHVTQIPHRHGWLPHWHGWLPHWHRWLPHWHSH